MIYIVKDLNKDKKDIVKIYYSNKPWEKFEKVLSYYSKSYELLLTIPQGGRALKKKIVSKLYLYKIDTDWFIYYNNIVSDIKNIIKSKTIKKEDLVSLLNSPGKMDKKLRNICDYILVNGEKSLLSNQKYTSDFKKLIDTLGIDKISSLKYRYKTCLTKL